MTTWKLAVTDDVEMHRGMLKMALAAYCRKHPDVTVEVVGECEHGGQLLERLSSLLPNVLTLDIRMPTMDGLTTLLHLRQRVGFNGPILMVSSEEEGNIDRFFTEAVSDKVRNMPIEQKLANMAKIEARLLQGVTEPGKINDLLTGCEKLRLDPITYAKHLGANGFLHKPYSPDQTDAVFSSVLKGGAFTSSI